MIKPLKLKRHDLQRYYRFSIPDVSDLIGATFTCTMINYDTKEIVINRRSAGCVITDPIAKELEYRWQEGDTDISGRYQIEFEIVPQDGGKFTVPENVALVLITDDLDGV